MPQASSFLQRARWDDTRGEIRDGDIRYMMIRADALMGLFRQLPIAERGLALVALADSIYEHGGRSARTYQTMGADDADALLAVISETAPQLGWGLWQFARPGNDSLSLVVKNSPFANGYGSSDTPVCAAIVGMLRAVGMLVYAGPCRVSEQRCASVSAEPSTRDLSDECWFLIEPV